MTARGPLGGRSGEQLAELALEVGRRLQLNDVVVVEWSYIYGDRRLYRNVTIGELEEGKLCRSPTTWLNPLGHLSKAGR